MTGSFLLFPKLDSMDVIYTWKSYLIVYNIADGTVGYFVLLANEFLITAVNYILKVISETVAKALCERLLYIFITTMSKLFFPKTGNSRFAYVFVPWNNYIAWRNHTGETSRKKWFFSDPMNTYIKCWWRNISMPFL